jgi:hypothetical protein
MFYQFDYASDKILKLSSLLYDQTKDLQTAIFSDGIDAETLSANNILTETRKEIVSGVTKVNTYVYTYTQNKVTKKISDTQFGSTPNAKDTFYLVYGKK